MALVALGFWFMLSGRTHESVFGIVCLIAGALFLLAVLFGCVR